MQLKFGLKFADLYERDGLIKLDREFENYFTHPSSLAQSTENFSQQNSQDPRIAAQSKDDDLIGKARILENFLVELFDIKKENNALKNSHDELQKIYIARREFVQRDVAKKFKDAADIDGLRILADLKISDQNIDDLEKQLASKILAGENLDLLTNYTRFALYSDKGRTLHKNGALFILPQKIDHQNLVSPCQQKTKRDGFNLTDNGFGLNRSLAETHYCIFCHKQKKDSCRTGFLAPSTPALTSSPAVIPNEVRDLANKTPKIPHFVRDDSKFKRDPLGVELHGCPLDEKISEMNLLKSEGFSLAALAVATIDNPMIAGTGHRICNDCMKSCIYQKQDPVDIPQAETQTLKDVLSLPYGFEIYSLLTRWNPLAPKKFPSENSGKKVLVCGLGPAGYTLAHYLLNDGHEVVAIDGLKIEPLPEKILNEPIKHVEEIYESLSKRLIQGFGGVAEYGITVRWDKNYLKIIRLLLERRKNFSMFGGLRFGSSITDKIAFEQYGFDHVALCIGAGRPNIINLKNNFAKGIRSASDFLMALQLTGAFREELFTNLQIRMPIVVIGGGLTAVDTACEAQAYYKIQIKKFTDKISKIGKEQIWPLLTNEEQNIAEEFLAHQALFEKDGLLPPVKILYRKNIQDAPAYRLNHQELNKSLAEGIEFIENITPLKAELDEFGHVKNLLCADGKSFECKTILMAAGTTPNLAPKLEDGLDFEINGKYFAEIDENHHHYPISHSARPQDFSVITKIDDASKKAVSFFGDLHPNFEGNVVKAMASAKHGHHEITRVLGFATFRQAQRDYKQDFAVKIEKIEKLSEHVFQVLVKAPLLANQTEIGHIFRLQNYHALAPKIGEQIMAMEGVPLTALAVDRELGIISGIVVDTGGSTHLIKNFKAGEPCIFMGPSGKPTEIKANEKVILIGGGRGNQPLTAIAEAMSAKGCDVTFFAGYRKNSFIVDEARMKNSCNNLIIAISDEPATDGRFQGSISEALTTYSLLLTTNYDRILTIGNDSMMHEIAKLRHQIPALAAAPIAITSLNSPMQCMLKGVCSQCLQKRKNDRGEWEYFYSCGNQDQNMDRVDFWHLKNRCGQNSLMEKVTKLWIEFLEKK